MHIRIKTSEKIIANIELTKHLDKFGYHPVQHTPGLCKQNTRETIFSLVVDNFAIKYASKQDTEHLLQALRSKYAIYKDWDASLYIDISLNWDYTAGHVNLSMPKYVARALHKFKQSLQKFHPDNKPEYSLHKHVEPNYGQKVQYAEPTNDAPTLDSVNINLIQKIVSTFLYYGIAVDNTILVTLSTIASVHGLGSIIVHRHHAKMGLHRRACRTIHAKICRQSATQVQTIPSKIPSRQ